MPSSPIAPGTSAAIDRLALVTDSPRGTNPSLTGSLAVQVFCFEVENSAVGSGCYALAPMCFEAEASSYAWSGIPMGSDD